VLARALTTSPAAIEWTEADDLATQPPVHAAEGSAPPVAH
jgi:ATP-dependent Lon protease